MDPSSDALGPQTPGQMSEIDLSSPLFYGTPGSARTPGSIRTPRGATTPVRQRADLGMSSRVRTGTSVPSHIIIQNHHSVLVRRHNNIRPVKYFKLLHYSNSALNPLLYILLNRSWKAAFKLTVCCTVVSL